MYDWILETPDDREKVAERYKIKVENKQLEYTVRDVHNGLRGNELKVSLNIEYMPYVGIFSKVKLPLVRQDWRKGFWMFHPII